MDSSPVVAPPFVVKPFALHPFRGLMLAASRIGDAASARVLARPYREVPARLEEWQNGGFILKDAHPAVYLHEYTADGITVRGLVGALELASSSTGPPSVNRDPGGPDQAVFPHEGVHPQQVDELAERMLEMEVNPAPILLVHRGPEAVRSIVLERICTAPAQEYVDRAGQQHRVWAIREPEVLAMIHTALAGSHALVADGHHRYAAYLRLQEAHPGTPWDRGLAMLVDQDDTPLFLGAIHRFVADAKIADLVERSADSTGVVVTSRQRPEALDALGDRTIVLTDGQNWVTCELTGAGDQLTVVDLHERLFTAWGIDEEQLTFHHSAEDTLNQLTRRPGVGILLPAPGFDPVTAAAATRQLLPQKATSFQPKPSVGVLMRNLRDE